MDTDGCVPDTATMQRLIRMYCRFGNVDKAKLVCMRVIMIFGQIRSGTHAPKQHSHRREYVCIFRVRAHNCRRHEGSA
jgi:hypothetical protein